MGKVIFFPITKIAQPFCAQVATAAIAEGAVGYVGALILEYRFVLLRSIGNYELFTATTAPGDLS